VKVTAGRRTFTRSRTIAGALPILAVLAVAPARASAQQVPPGTWRGRGSTVRTSDLGEAVLSVHYETDFAFVADAAGNVKGEATVRYTMSLDDSRFRTIVAQVQGRINEGIGLTPSPGLVALLGGMGTFRDVVGIQAGYEGGTVVREGPIRGRVTPTTVHLEWASAPAPLTYHVTQVHANRERPGPARTAPAYSPWIADGVVRRIGGELWRASVPEPRRSAKRGATVFSTEWSADRVGSGR
jgi:hypothetical protein